MLAVGAAANREQDFHARAAATAGGRGEGGAAVRHPLVEAHLYMKQRSQFIVYSGGECRCRRQVFAGSRGAVRECMREPPTLNPQP